MKLFLTLYNLDKKEIPMVARKKVGKLSEAKSPCHVCIIPGAQLDSKHHYDDQDVEEANGLIEELNEAILSKRNCEELFALLEKIGMYPIIDSFKNIEYFDIKLNVSSDPDHDLPGGILKWVLKNLSKLMPTSCRLKKSLF